MSRLLDRILTSCRRFQTSMLYDDTELIEQLSSLEGSNDAAVLARARECFLKTEPVATRGPPLSKLENIPVITANDVAQYIHALGSDVKHRETLRVSDFVLSMAPPFQDFFIEFQRTPNSHGMHAWGAHFEAISDPKKIAEISPPDDNGIPRWVLKIDTYLEKRKGKPFGPVAHHFCGLAEDGTWFRHSNGKLFWGGVAVRMSDDVPLEVHDEWAKWINPLVFPALMTISFMHCKNVKLNAIVPPEKLSRSHFKRHGRPLVRYGELTIDPLRRLLEKQRQGVGGSLGKALHLCRGRFKTFSPDAPLLGRATGTYWWAPQVRGSQTSGTTLKDYRVLAPSKIGRAYNDANENPPDAEREAPRSKEPDSAGRGLAAHNRTQNYLANVVSSMGWPARSPTGSEPQYDLAWLANDMLYVCEVKSLTQDNEERQLQKALGQVIRYKQQLTAKGHEPCFAVICTEKQPSDSSWDQTCESEGIVLVWPEVAMVRLKDAHTRRLN